MRYLLLFVFLFLASCVSMQTTPKLCKTNPGPQCMADVTAGPGNYVSNDIREVLLVGMAWCEVTSPAAECSIAIHAAKQGGWTFRHSGNGEQMHVAVRLHPGDVLTSHTHVSLHGMLGCSPGDDEAARKLPIPVFVQTRTGKVIQCGGADIQTAAF